jgi:DNA-binding transcriptional LysR family regulator
MNWNTFDLNLLVVFDAVMQEKNLTRAGRRMGMSQPAVSHALARLRFMLKNELFVRTPEGMRPTPRAERIAEPVRAALQELQVTLEADEFVPAESSREFTIAANNYAARAVIPALVHHVAKLVPSVVLDVRPVGRLDVLDQKVVIASNASASLRTTTLRSWQAIILKQQQLSCRLNVLQHCRMLALPLGEMMRISSRTRWRSTGWCGSRR